MNSLSVSILAGLIVVILFAPRRWAILGMAAGVLYLTQEQNVTVLGLNLFAVRFLEIAGFVRVMVRREFSFSNINGIDRALLLLYFYATLVFLFRSTVEQTYQVGLAVDAILCYFIFRGLIGDMDDFRWFLRAFAVLLIPYVALLLVEMQTAKNPFLLLGGEKIVKEVIREGRVRCMGSFRHPSLLGTLGASFLPLYVALAIGKMDRRWGLFGIVPCLAIVFLANSGGPVAAVAVGLAGWSLWTMRTQMYMIRRGILGVFVLLALIMKAPVWYLPAKLSFLTGGDAWHRSYLLDIAAKNIENWWLWGMPLVKTANWFPYKIAITGDADITNQFLSFGLASGLLTIVILIWMLLRCYRNLGEALNVTRLTSSTPETEYLLWGLGVTLTVHMVNWFAITYFDQTYVIWFMQLAAISTLTQTVFHLVPLSRGRPLVPGMAATPQT